MSNLPIFDVAGSAMSAQSLRLNTVASNLANADSVAGSPDAVYRAKQPVFSAEAVGNDPALAGGYWPVIAVSIERTLDSTKDSEARYSSAACENAAFSRSPSTVLPSALGCSGVRS